MIISVTKQIIDIISEEIMDEVSEHPGVRATREELNVLLETIFENNPELFSRVETAIYNYTENFAKHTCPRAFIYGMRTMSEINQITNQPNIPA